MRYLARFIILVIAFFSGQSALADTVTTPYLMRAEIGSTIPALVSGSLQFGTVQLANLPSAAGYRGLTFYCVDCYTQDGLVRGSLVTSNGTEWLDADGRSPTTTWTVTSRYNDAISATGADYNTATQVVSLVNTVINGPASGGVRLPNIAVNPSVTIFNRTSGTIVIYPSTTVDQIESMGPGVGFLLESNSAVILTRTGSSMWRIK